MTYDDTAIDAWIAQDPDPATAAALEDLRTRARGGDTQALAEIEAAFAGPLQFGTAGLRGPLGPGPARMNRVVVQQAAAGIAAWLREQGLHQAADGARGKVIIGYDARYNSDVFARDTAQIMAGAGFEPLLTAETTPTPVVAYGIGEYGCVAGVVVTASHNPPQDNGYKVYLGDGSQIVPPVDTQIAARIAAVAEKPLADIPRSDAITMVGDELVASYVEHAATLYGDAPLDVAWVYTAMHGVGAHVVMRIAERLGLTPPACVAEQQDPNPAFPTVAFPNPEEPGAVDLALELARSRQADLVVANDPDADRCAVAVPVAGQWRMLRGDELGWLLGDDALRHGKEGTYACSIVSSTLLSRMAEAANQPFATTLTGFKWIGRVPDLAFGYEEAIGYCVDSARVPDKDGMTALVRVLSMAAELKAQGLTLADRLDEICHRFGLHTTDQLSVRVQDLSIIGAAMARLRAHPPTTLLGEPVEVVDLAEGAHGLPPTDGVELIGQRVHVVARPSGTEPKLKCYLEHWLTPEESSDLVAARAHATDAMAALRAEMSTALGLA